MSDNFFFSLNSVLPIFMVISLGYYFRKKKILSEKTITELKNMMFNFALPVLLFRDVYRSNISVSFDFPLIAWAVASTGICFVFSWIFAEFYLKNKQNMIGAFVQGAFRGNYAIIGLPLMANITQGVGAGKGALITAFIIPIYNVLSVVVLSAKNPYPDGSFAKNVFTNVSRNPLIIGVFSGLAVSALNIEMPAAIETGVNYIAALGTPLALITIGGTIKITESVKSIKPALISSIIKTVICPLVIVPISVFAFGFKGEELTVLYVMHSAPTAVSTYIMAEKMGSDGSLASNIIILTTLVSVFSFTIGIYLLKTFSFI